MSDDAAYRDLNHFGNSEKYRSGRVCIESGCKNPAGTYWSPYWCVPCNIKRMDRVTQSLNELVSGFDKTKEGS